MSAEPQASSEGGTEPPAMDVIRKLDDITVGVRVEAKDCYGKWYGNETYVHRTVQCGHKVSFIS
jgi:hypothetical protein